MDQMPPPPRRHASGKPPAAAMSDLRRQAFLTSAHLSAGDSLLGPLSAAPFVMHHCVHCLRRCMHDRTLDAGTIPDSAAVSGEAAEPDIVDGIPAGVAAAAMPELHPWDHYFDEVQDLRLEDRGGTFRHVLPTAQLCMLPKQRPDMPSMQGVHGGAAGPRAVLPARLRLHRPDLGAGCCRRQAQVPPAVADPAQLAANPPPVHSTRGDTRHCT